MYRTDDRDYPFVYCITASVRVCDPMGMKLSGVMGPGQFTGDLALLLGQTAFADCIVTEPGEVVVIPQAEIVELAKGRANWRSAISCSRCSPRAGRSRSSASRARWS